MQIGKTDTSGISALSRAMSASNTATTKKSGETPANNADGSATSSDDPPATGSLRTQSAAILTTSQDDGLSKLNTDKFADMVAQKTQLFAKTLMDVFKAADIPTDEAINLTLDGSGRVTTDSPYKKRIEKLFEDRPELAKQLKDVMALNSLVALNEAMHRFTEAKKKARDGDEHDQAEADYLRDCLSIQMRSNSMTLADGALTSPAMTYMATGE